MKTAITAALALLAAATPAGVLAQDATFEGLMEARFQPPPSGWEMPRTQWGDPDLRGKWPVDYLGRTPRERSPAMGERAFLTEEEYRRAFDRAQGDLDRYEEENQAGLMAMGHWAEFGHPLRQSSMIVEPANGRYPSLTPLGEELRANERTSWNTYVFENMDDFGIFDRCLTRGMPGSMLPGAYNGGIEIFQSPGLVVITLEMIHESRMVYLDGREAPPADVQYDLGFSRGHWEGDTLVMEGHYKLDLPWLREDDYGMYEYACHEGNVQVRGYIMSTSPRFADERAAAWAEQGVENHVSEPVR